MRSLILSLLPFLLLLLGCGNQEDPFAIFEGGELIELDGVIHFPEANGGGGDYEPGKLLVQTSLPLTSTNVLQLIQTRLPDADAYFSARATSTFQVSLPEGMSLEEASTALKEDSAVQEVYPVYLRDRSAAISLHVTDTTQLVNQSTRLTYLVSEDEPGLLDYAESWVVRIRARIQNVNDGVDPDDYIQVLSVEKIDPHRIELEGTISLLGEKRDCFLLIRSGKPSVALVGSEATRLSQDYDSGQRVRVQLQDLGLSTDSCSGGPMARVESYQVF